MAEINNSLALGVKPAEFDIAKTLLPAAQINYLRANTEQNQQETQYRQFQQDSNEGYRVPEVNTLAEAHTKQMGIAGQIGNMLVGDQSLASRKQAIQAARDSGVKIDPNVEQHILSAPASQVKQYGQNMQRAGQTATANIEQNPNQIGNRAAAGASGAAAGAVDEPYKPPGPAMTAPQVDNAVKTRTNRDGTPRVLSLEGNVPEQPGAPGTTSLEKKQIIDARGLERGGTAQKNVEEFSGYKQAAANSSTTKTVLRSLQDDAERIYTGKGAEPKAAAQKYLLAAQSLPGVGPLIKHFVGDQTDPVAAAENISKNIGIISRQAVGDIHETSAAALESVQNSIPTIGTSNKGLKLATSQMMAIEDFKQARLQQAQAWKDSHNQSLDGFAADWNKNMGPATFVMARLPREEQLAVRKRLGATPEGKRTLDAIDKQLAWGHKNGLDSVID
jgi:hypothetical protein